VSVARFHSAGDSGRSLQSGSVIHGSAGSSSGSGNSSLGKVMSRSVANSSVLSGISSSVRSSLGLSLPSLLRSVLLLPCGYLRCSRILFTIGSCFWVLWKVSLSVVRLSFFVCYPLLRE